MTKGGVDDVSKRLTNTIQVGTTTGNLSTIAAYETALHGLSGYGLVTSSFSIPLFAKQTVVAGDAAGSYKITLTFTFTPGT
jgi:hypothetical protein